MIRRGTPEDLHEITRVRTSVRENHLSVEQMEAIGITHESTSALMISGELGCWVAEDEGLLVGFSMAERSTGHLFGLFVHPDAEGQGHGSRLLAAAEDWLRGLGFTEAYLTTDPETRAYRFYLLQGWQDTGASAGHFAEDHVLRKRL
jgi:GNAT superfamily N-acetyltransferase